MADNPRNIILLSDGTGNSASSLFRTNVRRLYEALDLADPKHPSHPRQFAYYDDGVGTSSFRPLAILGGAFGFGLARNVRDLYAFLCRTYRPGDRIYAFGFSRGAFTIRVTVGLIASQGIVAYDGDEATLARNVRNAFRAYRRERYGWRPLTVIWRLLRDAALELSGRSRGFTPFPQVKRHRIGDPGEGTIEFVGVWDTVDAYGLPIEELTRAVDTVVMPLTMPDANLSRLVRRARHALSLDDQRNTFHPRLWNEEAETDPCRIRQVWFAGVHADVGGGYPDDGLAHVTLRWMMDEAEAARPGDERLRFLEEIRSRQRALADENAPLHDSRRGLASYYRYKPRRVSALADQPVSLARRFQVQLKTPIVHECVLRRIQAGQDGYAPISLPPSFRVERIGGGPDEMGEARLWGCPQEPSATRQRDFARRQENVWNFVWWRRGAYFITLGGTLFLVALPLFQTADGCSSWACFLSPAILAAGHLLPGLASSWIQVFAENPTTFLAGLAIILSGTLMGRHLDTRISDDMRRLWYSTELKPKRKAGMVDFKRPSERGPVNAAVQVLRTSRSYVASWEVVRRIIFPSLAFIVALAFLLGGANIAALSGMEALGAVCGNRDLTTAGTTLRTSSVCHLAYGEVERGAAYRIRVAIPARIPGDPEPIPAGCEPPTAGPRSGWWDCDLPATPNGLLGSAPRWMLAFTLFRRHVDQPWHKLMARIGSSGSDVYAPDWRLVSTDNGEVYEAVLRARRTGPLYLYVNEAAPVVALDHFYRTNNRGTADIEIVVQDREEPRLGAARRL